MRIDLVNKIPLISKSAFLTNAYLLYRVNVLLAIPHATSKANWSLVQLANRLQARLFDRSIKRRKERTAFCKIVKGRYSRWALRCRTVK